MEKLVYTITEFSQIFDISKDLTRKLIKLGLIPTIRLGVRNIRIPKNFVDRMLENPDEFTTRIAIHEEVRQ